MPGTYNMDDYIDVAKRIDIFRGKYPEASLDSEILVLPEAFAGKFIAVKACAYRSPSDQRPGVGLAWEPVPGPTSFTKDSELMNAQTAAWGRAIVAVLAADTKKGIASQEEVKARQGQRRSEPNSEPPSGRVPAGASSSEPEIQGEGVDGSEEHGSSGGADPRPGTDEAAQVGSVDGPGHREAGEANNDSVSSALTSTPPPDGPPPEEQWQRARQMFGSEAAVLNGLVKLDKLSARPRKEDVTASDLYRLIMDRVGASA